MPRICYYVSDHGWGHASRTIGVIRALLDLRSGTEVIIKSDSGYDLLRESFASDSNVVVIRSKKDFGLVTKASSIEVDRGRTRACLADWVAGWDHYMEEERAFCAERNVSLIVSDIAPQPFLVATKLGVPSVGISNFTWAEVYEALYGEIHEVRSLREAYATASVGLILPLSTPALPFRESLEIGLVVRRLTRDRAEIRRILGVGRDKLLVWFGFGKSVALGSSGLLTDLANALLSIRPDARFLSVDAEWSPRGYGVLLPSDDPETQDYIGACDLMIGKPAYGTVSECLQGRVPMILAGRSGMAEDDAIMSCIRSLGAGKGLLFDAMLDGSWLGAVRRLHERRHSGAAPYALPERCERDGSREAAVRILEMC
jgi:hypothetical protein